MPTWRAVNSQLVKFALRLQEEIGLAADECAKVASLIAADVRFLPLDAKAEIVAASPIPLPARLEELVAFQRWMELASAVQGHPEVVRAQVVVQNYICFVYLKDACFEILARRAPNRSVAARCADYLSRGTVRDFRNAFSHANWCYKSDYSGLDCWVLQDARNKLGPMRQFTVSQVDLDFWQTLARAVAYATYEQFRGLDLASAPV